MSKHYWYAQGASLLAWVLMCAVVQPSFWQSMALLFLIGVAQHMGQVMEHERVLHAERQHDHAPQEPKL